MRKPAGELRRGWTTGACAAAATKAAYLALLTGRFPDPVSIRLPRASGRSSTLWRARGARPGDRGRPQGCRRRSGRDPRRDHPGERLPWRARQRRHVHRRRGRGHGHPAGAAGAGRPAGDQSRAPPDDPGHGEPGRAAPRRRRRPRSHDRDPGRRDAGAADHQRPARDRRRALDPRHHRRGRALFLRILDPLDPSRHRCRPGSGAAPRRGGHRSNVGEGGPARSTACPRSR